MGGLTIREATIIGVDPEAGTVNVELDYPRANESKTIAGVRVNCLNGAAASGGMPDIGQRWLVSTTSDSPQQWFALDVKSDPAVMNTSLGPGDYGWEIPFGGRVCLRKNGNIELFSSATNAMYMVPAEQLLRLNAVNMHIATPQGAMKWEPSVFSFVVGNALGASTFSLKLGDTKVPFGASSWAGGDSVAAQVCGAYHAEVNEAGDASIAAGNAGVATSGVLMLDVGTDLSAVVGGGASISASGEMSMSAATVSWSATVNMELSAPVIKLKAGRIVLNEEDGFALDGLRLLQWFVSSFRVDPATGKIDPECLSALVACLNFTVQL